MKRTLLMLAAVLAAGTSQAQIEQASWIACPIVEGASLPALRKRFVLHERPERATLQATALGVYDVTVNGRPVTAQELKPGWTDYRKEVAVQSMEIAPALQAGENEIEVQLSLGWWAGAISRGAYGTQLPLAFRAAVTADGVPVTVTDGSWEQSDAGPLLEGDIYNGERYDARRRHAWHPVAPPADTFAVALVPQEGPEVRIRDEALWRTPQSVAIYRDTVATGTEFGTIRVDRTLRDAPFVLRRGETAVIDFGQNLVGWIAFEAQAAPGVEIAFAPGEMLNETGDRTGRLEDGPGGSVWRYNLRSAAATLRYTFRGDAAGESYRPHHTFMGFRYAAVTATGDVEIRRLTGQVVGSEIAEWGTFRCSDESVNQLYRNIWWSQRGNFLSVPTDCPQRDERLGWTGDTQIFSRTALYQSDAAAFYRKWMRDLRNSQRDDGAYPDIAPWPNFWGYGTAAWGDAGVIVPWNVYEMTGDTTILAENYASMSRWMAWLAAQEEDAGGVHYRYPGGGTATGDWLAYDPLDARYVAVAYYAHAARLMERIAAVLGREEDAAHYRALFAAIRREFQQRYLDAEGGLVPTTQTACLLALHFDLLPETSRPVVREALRRKIEENGWRLSTGFVGTGILCTTLSEEGMDDLAYALLLQRENPSWLYSVDQGATTVWERWDSYTREGGFHKHPWNMNSFNHYAYGAISEWFYAGMCGIRPAAPGFRRVLLAPHADRRPDDHPTLARQPRIRWARCRIRTPQGEIAAAWERTAEGSFVYRFTLPAGVDCELAIPGLTRADRVEIERTGE